MMQQFQNVLRTPKQTPDVYLKRSHDLILYAIQTMLPSNYDYKELLYHKNNSSSLQQFIQKLIEFFLKIIEESLQSSKSYQALQQQTQRLQMTIRSQIKMDHQKQMYMTYLEQKCTKYENYLRHQKNNRKSHELHCSQDLNIPLNNKQTSLMKQRLLLLKQNQRLKRQIENKNIEIRKLNKIPSETLENIKQLNLSLISNKSQNNLKCSNIYMETDQLNHYHQKSSKFLKCLTLSKAPIQPTSPPLMTKSSNDYH